MESLYKNYKVKGLRILAFPANNFGRQEPGTNAEIKHFCTSEYNVTFDLFEKVSVIGDDICPLYKFLTDEKADHGQGGKVPWNFQKYLVDRKGKPIAKFGPRTLPDDAEFIKALVAALADK